MPTAEELILEIQASGVGETEDKLQGVEQSMEDTAESAGDSAESLEGFSERFSGAMSAAVAALAIGSAALLSQIPILGDAFSGVAAIAQALIFQVDSLARQLGAGGFVDAAFNAANWIYELEGAAGDLAGALTAIGSIAAIVGAAMLKFGISFGAVASAASTVISALTTVATVIAGIVAGISAATAAVVIAIAAIVAFAAAYALNLGGVRDATNNILGSVWDTFTSLGSDLIGWAANIAGKAYQWGVDIMGGLVDGLGSLVDTVVDGFTSVSRGLIDWASSLADAAYDWGVGLIERFINGLKDTLSGAGDFLGELSAATGIDIPDVSATGTATVIGGAVGGGAGAALANTAAGAFARSGRSGDGGTTIDGRQITESTGRYRSDPARRQGL